ncbi:MAG: class I SAM-dependent methyltransferase [Candidatus Omnitrophica bacterium]|nr:class I SAM-dependent methyltransferase [Candidatus Omnitrophota bacterium]
MITENRYKIAQEAERTSHIRKKDINILDRRLSSAQKIVLPYIQQIENLINKDNFSVVDVGSGPTCLARFFKSPHKTYVDPLMDFYQEYYREKLPVANNSTFVASMAEKMPFPSDSFDVALCYNMLDHTFKPANIVAEIKRILKPGGYVLLGIYTHGPILKFVRTLAEKTVIFKEKPHPYSFTIGNVISMLNGEFLIRQCDIRKGREIPFDFKRRFYVLILQKPAHGNKA